MLSFFIGILLHFLSTIIIQLFNTSFVDTNTQINCISLCDRAGRSPLSESSDLRRRGCCGALSLLPRRPAPSSCADFRLRLSVDRPRTRLRHFAGCAGPRCGVCAQAAADFSGVTDRRRYWLPGWPSPTASASGCGCGRGSAALLFGWRLFCVTVATAVIVYQYMDVHYGYVPAASGNHFDPSPSSSSSFPLIPPRPAKLRRPSSPTHYHRAQAIPTAHTLTYPACTVSTRFGTFISCGFTFATACIFSFHGWRSVRSAAKSERGSSNSKSRGSGPYDQWLGVEEDRYSRDFEYEDILDDDNGSRPNFCHRLHHVVMS